MMQPPTPVKLKMTSVSEERKFELDVELVFCT